MSISFAKIQEEIANMLDVPSEELTDEQKVEMDAYLNELGNQEVEKVDGFCQFIRLQTERAKACKAEGERLVKKAMSISRNIDWLKAFYVETMMKHGIKKINGTTYSIGLKSTESVTILDESIIPERFFVIKEMKSVSKNEIKAAIKAGEIVSGANLITKQSLTIR